LLRQAISLCPRKPEAYLLLTELYETTSDWINVYTYSSIALDVCNDSSVFYKSINFVGKYAFLFQKAASAWWVGKPAEARKIYRILLNEYLDQLNDKYKNLLQSNLSQLGCGPESNAIRTYTKNLLPKLKYKFPGIQNIDRNFSQVYQDMFILTVLNGKINGTYLEIGSSEPFKNSNTVLLEKLGWKGVGIEYNEDYVKQHKQQRTNPVIHSDALLLDYNKILNKYLHNIYTIDYLQLDIEPSNSTYEALTSIPFDKYKFNIITYEHDHYVDVNRCYRNKSREYLFFKGYILIVPNVSPDEFSPFEDWWIHPDIKDSISYLPTLDTESINQVEKYFLNN
jgi:hypothetical protein